jgi:hypothetical protein
MQNRQELRQKGHDRGQKTCRERGKNYHFQKGREGGGGEINIVFGPKYKPLASSDVLAESYPTISLLCKMIW